MKNLLISILISCPAILTGATSFPTAAADIATLITECAACHGKQGLSTQPDIPVIAGFAATNIADQLHYFQNGRPGKDINYVYNQIKKQDNMTKIARRLDDTQIEALSDYYEKLPYIPVKQQTDSAKVAQGKKIHMALCERCHTKGGSVASDEAGMIAGQHKTYLRRSLQEYHDKRRVYDEEMDKHIVEMSAENMDALAEFYAAQG